ncbi:MAG: UDP-3-O-[3-hydroxymyristoyl] N-acetylglucosamine deacetylase [Desulfuromonas sp.]|nr:MAG: UDP-3-O-[3-hydroxymyristoyl] N-acetylglucosamine deacetylase [Desulfuromonas sp.]
MIFQSTIAKPLSITGIGLHSGRPVTMLLRPASAGTGIVFHRRAGDRIAAIEATVDNVVDTRMATVLGKQGLTVSTVEHFLAALSVLGIDNLDIDIDGPEVPIMDGSAEPFLDLIREAGICCLQRSRKYLAIRKPVSVIDGEKRVTLIPSRFFRITYDIAFEHPAISLQRRTVKVAPDTFEQEIAAARTFGFLEEVEYLKANGLAQGGSLENAVVINKQGVMNPEGFRYNDECVRHKILDAIGDFSLLGYPLLGHVKAYKAGHDIHCKAVQRVLQDKECWQLVEFSEKDLYEALNSAAPTYATDMALSEA